MATRINPPPIEPTDPIENFGDYEAWTRRIDNEANNNENPNFPFAELPDYEKARGRRWLEAISDRPKNTINEVNETVKKHGHMRDAYVYAFQYLNGRRKAKRDTRHVTIITYTAAILCLLYLLWCVAGLLFNRECTGASCAEKQPISSGTMLSSTGDGKSKQSFPFGDFVGTVTVPKWGEPFLQKLNGLVYTCRSRGGWDFCELLTPEQTGNKN